VTSDDGAAVTVDLEDALTRHASGEAHRALGTLLEEHPPRTNLTDLYLAYA
jgi:citrate lyase beta subunit